MKEIKLQKYLQECGVASRRDIRQWIHDGRFQVQGRVVTDPNFPVRFPGDTVHLNGRLLKLAPQGKSYFAFNKPVGVVSTLADPEGRPTVGAYIGRIRERVYPVGRLDFNSDGLMLLTNDGDLANFILSARNGVPKTYLLKVKGALAETTRQRLERGMFLEGERLNPFTIEEVKMTGSGNSWLRVTINEGKKHILRKAFKYSGHPVEKLRRVAIGTLTLGRLPLGEWRELRDEEVEAFKKAYRYGEPRSGKSEGKKGKSEGRKREEKRKRE
ncbi:MAG: rRNA pseudouridine synthase [Acidobacteria bacterium]|jgi:23S rRNA pseudouridine2605 synthase|nr:rRNA pseudouridine synthase [Acidobacteriota bacterium]